MCAYGWDSQLSEDYSKVTKYKVTVQKKDGVIYEGLMAVKEPQIVNGLYAIAGENGGWRYIQRDEVSEIRFTPMHEEERGG